MLIKAKGGGGSGESQCPLTKWNGEPVGWEATGLCLLTSREDPSTGGTGDGNRRGSVRGGLDGSAWAKHQSEVVG
jgi:hypothetical protein